jgi:hypothetical protein
MAHTLLLTKNGEQVSFSKEPAAIYGLLRNGTYVVTISRQKEPRSLDQNALMWLWFTCIERETGTHRQDVHDYYCRQFLRKTINWNGEDVIVVEGTSKLTKERMTTFLNQVQADASTEFGITLPSPEDKYFQEFYETYK